jgi:hypothetical protein
MESQEYLRNQSTCKLYANCGGTQFLPNCRMDSARASNERLVTVIVLPKRNELPLGQIERLLKLLCTTNRGYLADMMCLYQKGSQVQQCQGSHRCELGILCEANVQMFCVRQNRIQVGFNEMPANAGSSKSHADGKEGSSGVLASCATTCKASRNVICTALALRETNK